MEARRWQVQQGGQLGDGRARRDRVAEADVHLNADPRASESRDQSGADASIGLIFANGGGRQSRHIVRGSVVFHLDGEDVEQRHTQPVGVGGAMTEEVHVT